MPHARKPAKNQSFDFPSPFHRGITGAFGAASLLAAILLAGCSGQSGAAPRSVQRLTPVDFRGDRPATDPEAGSPGTTGEPDGGPRVISAHEARGGDPDVLTLVGRPADLERMASANPPATTDGGGHREDPRPVITGPIAGESQVIEKEGIVIDEMVGQINGRPVYAAEFLSTLDDQLSAQAIDMSREEWIREASRVIQNQLLERIRDELLIAEFNASLTYEQRIGLFAFVEQIQQGIIDRDLGSAARADERLQDQENISLRGKAEAEFNREVVSEQLEREVNRKIQVSWRDIERYYNQNIEVFSPPSKARLRVLRVPESAQQRVAEALSDRSTISEVIAAETTFRTSDGGMMEVQLGSGGMAEAEFFGPVELNEPATQLSEGEITEPIEFGGDIWWIYLEDIEKPEGVSLYEAQNRIERLIRAEREQRERARYFEKLFGSSTVTEQQIAQMRDRLIRFAAERYLGDGRSDW